MNYPCVITAFLSGISCVFYYLFMIYIIYISYCTIGKELASKNFTVITPVVSCALCTWINRLEYSYLVVVVLFPCCFLLLSITKMVMWNQDWESRDLQTRQRKAQGWVVSDGLFYVNGKEDLEYFFYCPKSLHLSVLQCSQIIDVWMGVGKRSSFKKTGLWWERTTLQSSIRSVIQLKPKRFHISLTHGCCQMKLWLKRNKFRKLTFGQMINNFNTLRSGTKKDIISPISFLIYSLFHIGI